MSHFSFCQLICCAPHYQHDTCHFISCCFTLPWLAVLIPLLPPSLYPISIPPSIGHTTMSFWRTVLNEEVLGREGKGGRQRRRWNVWDLWSFQYVTSVPCYKMQSKLWSENSPFPYNLTCLSIQNRLTKAVARAT